MGCTGKQAQALRRRLNSRHVRIREAIALDYVPVVPRLGKDGGVCDVGAVHGPDRRRPVVVLPQDVGLAVIAAPEAKNKASYQSAPVIWKESGRSLVMSALGH